MNPCYKLIILLCCGETHVYDNAKTYNLICTTVYGDITGILIV